MPFSVLGARLSLFAVLWCMACSSQSDPFHKAFNTDWQNDRGASIERIERELRSGKPPLGADIALGTSDSGLLGVTLDTHQRWTSALRPDTRPVIANDLVVLTSSGKVYALEAKTGRQVWSVSSERRRLRGAGDDGNITLVSLGHPDLGEQSLLIAVERSGRVVNRMMESMPLGSPAVTGGFGFVPWGNQYVSVLDLKRGEEVARLLLREQVSHAMAIGGQLYFGQLGLTRFDDRIGRASSGGARHMALPTRQLPGSPEWLQDGTQLLPVDAGARSRIRLYARPALEGTQLTAEGGRFAATYFRLAMGLDASDASLRWVRTFAHDLIGGAAGKDGFAFCDVKGNVWFVDRTGAMEDKPLRLNARLQSCVVQLARRSIEPTTKPDSLVAQLGKAVSLNDPEMLAAKRFLLRELAPLKDPIATKILIDLLSNPKTEPAIEKQAERLLSQRTTGASYMLEALERHYDFLSDQLRVPPVAAIADALAKIKHPRAAGLLAKQLNDPANHQRAIERVAAALAVLATAEQLEELKMFFALYRATADDQELVNAVLDIGRAILRAGGEEGWTIVERAARDELTAPAVRNGLISMLKSEKPKERSASAG